jgi:hypothetical protein
MAETPSPDLADMVKSEVLRVCPLMDDDTVDYALGWFEDEDNLSDGSSETLTDFLGPLLLDAGAESDDVEELCARLSVQIFADRGETRSNGGLARLKETYTAMDTDFTSSTLDLSSSIVTDITWTSGKGRKAPISSVDLLKLKQQEERQKQKKGGTKKDHSAWDPNYVPPMWVLREFSVSSQAHTSLFVKPASLPNRIVLRLSLNQKTFSWTTSTFHTEAM